MTEPGSGPKPVDPADRMLLLGPLIVVGGVILIGLVLSATSSAAVAFAVVFPVGLIVLTAAIATGLAIARALRSR